MKYLLCGTLSLIATTGLADVIQTRSKDDRPEIRAAIERLNTEVKAWNARCTVTNSDAEQKWCEEERQALEIRKITIAKGDVPSEYRTKVAGYPTVDVTLRHSTRGKILKRVQTDSTGHFDLGTFPASVYIMEFRARKAAGLQGQRFAIRIDGIKEKGRQTGIEAKYLIGGFGVDLETTPGIPVRGQVTTGSLAPTKRMVWIRPSVGTNFSGYWAEEGASLATAGSGKAHIPLSTIQKMQDHGDQ